MPNCEQCGKEVNLPFECKFCGGHFCLEHRLPESHNCPNLPPRTPLGSWQTRKEIAYVRAEERKISKFASEGDYHFERKETLTHPDKHEEKIRPSSKFKRLLSIDWKTKKLATSLKLWFPLFWFIVGVLYLAEGKDPTSFYNSVPDPIKYMLYIFTAGISGWTGYKIFNKLDYNTSSDRGLFGLKILSGILLMTGVFMLIFGIFYQTGFFTDSPFKPTLSLARATMSIFLIVLSFAFILISAYLLFKFERRSGIIIYRR
jgi:hypothetical protein